MCLPDGESNPGLLRDRQGYLPLYYRGLASGSSSQKSNLTIKEEKQRKGEKKGKSKGQGSNQSKAQPCSSLHQSELEKKKVYSLEPDLNQRPMDVCYAFCQLQSTALPTELSRVAMIRSSENTIL